MLAQAEAARRVADRARALLNHGEPVAHAAEIRTALLKLHRCIAELHETAAYVHSQTAAWVQRVDFQQS